MIVGEMCLLVASVFILIGVAKGITARLQVNDYLATFAIFLIVFLNVCGGIALTDRYKLFLGGVLSVLLATYCLVKRSETAGDLLLALLSSLVTATLAFLYSMHFSARTDIKHVLLLACVPIAVWSAISARRTFASCLFSSVVGSFIGMTFYLVFVQKGGDIGGGESFAVMWVGALFGLVIQYLFAFMLRVTKSPRANSYFEAGEMQESSDDGREK